MISKELLSKVLGIADCRVNQMIGTTLEYYSSIKGWRKINIYELAHKCKEWAWNTQNYQISSMFINLEFKTAKELSEAPQCQANMWNDNGEFAGYFDAKTEPEAIFKACKWILDNKDK